MPGLVVPNLGTHRYPLDSEAGRNFCAQECPQGSSTVSKVLTDNDFLLSRECQLHDNAVAGLFDTAFGRIIEAVERAEQAPG